MSDNKVKAKWEKPKLIVLARGKPEEQVLGQCKHSGAQWINGDVGVYLDSCAGGPTLDMGCVWCEAATSS